jgi:hypothetical protein
MGWGFPTSCGLLTRAGASWDDRHEIIEEGWRVCLFVSLKLVGLFLRVGFGLPVVDCSQHSTLELDLNDFSPENPNPDQP